MYRKREADETQVCVELDPAFKIVRSKKVGKNICYLNGKKVTEKALNAAIEDRVDIKIDNIKLASSEEVLEATKPEELLKVALKTPYNKQAYDLSILSGGEKLITRFLMLDMLSQLTGTNLMFIDNIESLDKDALERLADILNGEAFTSLYDHVFVAGVDHPDVMEKFS